MENGGIKRGEPTPDSTRSALLSQVLQRPTGTNRGWSSLIERFWAAIEKTDTCWLWRGTVTNGYGQIAVGPFRRQIRFRAHRLSWLLHFGDVPDGLEVMHACQEARCVRPAHLELGVHQQNMAYAAKNGRMRRDKSVRVSPVRGARGGGIRPRGLSA